MAFLLCLVKWQAERELELMEKEKAACFVFGRPDRLSSLVSLAKCHCSCIEFVAIGQKVSAGLAALGTEISSASLPR